MRGIDHDVALTLGGWASGTSKEGAEAAEAYGRGFRLATLFEVLKQIDYPSLDLRRLYQSPVRPKPDGPQG